MTGQGPDVAVEGQTVDEAVLPEAHVTVDEVTPTAADEPPDRRVAALPARVPPVVGAALDVLVQAAEELRRGSFYAGLVLLGLAAPYALLLWGLEVAAVGRTDPQLFDLLFESGFGEALAVATILAFAGFVVVFNESQNVAVLLAAGRLADQPVGVRAAVQRSRDVFWRTILAAALVNVPLSIVQLLAADLLSPAFGTGTEITVVTATLIAALLFSPLVYARTGIVLGSVGVTETLRRSVRLFRARPLLGLVVALIGVAAQFLIALGLFSGLELAFGVGALLGIGPASETAGLAIATVALVALLFALGTLLFTVLALTTAPQVAAFIALTHRTPYLDELRRSATVAPPALPAPFYFEADKRQFRWLTRPVRAGIALGALVVAAGISSIIS